MRTVTSPDPRVARKNLFLVAAVALPVVVALFFVLASAIPRWLVAPPQHDLVLRVGRPYAQPHPRSAVEFNVRDGRLEATVRPVLPDRYEQPWSLVLFEQRTMRAREIALDLPDVAAGAVPQTVMIDAFGGRRLLAGTRAPDGYELRTGRNRGPGIVGELFGMRQYDSTVTLANKGRVVAVPLPSGYDYYSPVYAIGWLTEPGAEAR
jgi:hypothetical protein